MPSDQDVDTSRTAVKTYVPAYQKAVWQEHADRLGMTQSEFVRTMVQAGRRDFSLTDDSDSSGNGTSRDVRDVVVAVLREEEFLTWENLLDSVTEDVESQLEDAVEELQDDNRIRHSGKNGGYTLVER